MSGKTLTMRMHRDRAGNCWADSDNLPGYSAAGPDFTTVMGRLGEACAGDTLLGVPLADLVDLRWQWCRDPARGVVAVSDALGDNGDRPPCPCEMEEETDA
jgi:hypothetical protein